MDAFPERASRLRHLDCSSCGERTGPDAFGTCGCGSPLICAYELAGLAPRPPERRPGTSEGVFRWSELLPVRDAARRVSLGEGDTPVIPLPRLARELGLAELLVKDESLQPCGSFKARGLSVAMAAHAERGALSVTLPTAGNAGGAAAAYARRHGLPCRVVIPSAATPTYRLESRLAGARVVGVSGDISAAADWVRTHADDAADHVLSTFREPFRVEGKKTMAFELWEAFGDDLPDVVAYPTGGGVGLVGMHLAFTQLREAGVLRGTAPRFLAAQVDTCAPIVRAVDAARASGRALTDVDVEPWESTRRTLAEGLRVPRLAGGRLVLRALAESEGMARAVSESDLVQAIRKASASDGVLLGAEGGVALAAVMAIAAAGDLRGLRVLTFNTGSIYKSPETLQAAGVG